MSKLLDRDVEMREEEKEKLIELIKQYGEKLVEEVFDYNGYVKDVIEMFEENYHGIYESEIAFAEILWEETIHIPAEIAPYINYEVIARDLFINDYISFDIDHQIHVFGRL